MKTKVKQQFYKLKEFYEQYERFLIPAALTLGFITDAFAFQAIGLGNLKYIFLGHLVFIGINIGAINYFKEEPPIKRIGYHWQFLAPLFVQFSFGNLFNGFLIFYFQSGSFFASWPFFLVLAGLIVGNEIARRKEVTPLLQIGVYFFTIFAYLNLVFPYTFKQLGLGIFLVSGFLALALIVAFVYGVSRFSEAIKHRKKKLWVVIGAVFIFINVLYFANWIPPIPLALKDIGVYHHVEKVNNHYNVVGEKCQNWDNCLFTRKKMHITQEGEPIYMFSAVHAPLGMTLEIAHEWSKYDTQENSWITKTRLPYEIQGGREGGYRLYTYSHVTPGLYRVNIETKSGQVIGRKSFRVVKSEKKPKLFEELK
ncbi:MAG: DUF2914 domain-containing protein [Candidatus Paceibacterota bacterium]